MNTCPAGIATQDKELRKRFIGKSEYTINFFRFLAQEIREYLAEMGFAKFDDIVGRTDLLEVNQDVVNWKMKNVDFSRLLYVPKEAAKNDIHNTHQNEQLSKDHIDFELIKESKKAMQAGDKVWIEHKIVNVDRTVGAMLSGEISRKYGEAGLAKDTINCKFIGTAGQSFGAFLVKGVTFQLIGDSNDYIGKGLSGGKIIVFPPPGSTFKPEENIIIGNTSFYGATSGEAYIRGVAGERFCVRNSLPE